MNRDKYGIIGQVQSNGVKGAEHNKVEGGDALAWNGYWLYLNEGFNFGSGSKHIVRINTTTDFVKFFEVGFGAYVRHPDPKHTNFGFGAHYRHPWRGCISRDQFTGLLCALIKGREYMALLRVFAHWSLRGFLLAYNNIDNGTTDPDKEPWKFPGFTGPDIWATALRGFGVVSWLFWPLLCLLDLHTLFNAWIHNFKKEDDMISFLGKFMVSREYVPTPTSWLAAKTLDYEEAYRELEDYWCRWRDNCEFVELYKRKLERLRV